MHNTYAYSFHPNPTLIDKTTTLRARTRSTIIIHTHTYRCTLSCKARFRAGFPVAQRVSRGKFRGFRGRSKQRTGLLWKSPPTSLPDNFEVGKFWGIVGSERDRRNSIRNMSVIAGLAGDGNTDDGNRPITPPPQSSRPTSRTTRSPRSPLIPTSTFSSASCASLLSMNRLAAKHESVGAAGPLSSGKKKKRGASRRFTPVRRTHSPKTVVSTYTRNQKYSVLAPLPF